MRNILFFSALLLWSTSCLNTSQPENTSASSLPVETSGVPENTVHQGAAFTISTDAFYQAKLKPVSAVEQVISLWLTPMHEAKMTVNYLGDRPNVLTSGVWKTLENGNLSLKMSRVGEKDSTSLEFKPEGDKIVYVAGDFSVDDMTLYATTEPGKQ